MTSLFMGQLLADPVPADERNIRNTATPVDNEKPAAEATSMPDPQEFDSDKDQQVGFGPRQLASDWHEGEPVDISQSIPVMAEVTESTRIINSQVSSSGTAAQREASGRVHRSLSYAVGIEPVGDLQENHRYGETYFARNPRDIQTGMGSYMTTPPSIDQNAAATGKVVSRDATAASIYDLFLQG
jgi:hypothetical protein